jgi:hypothetical protein
VNKPDTRITLSLKPKALDPHGAITKKVQSASAPEVLPPGIDRAVLEELRQAVRTYDYLRQFGEPIEFWEAVRLARARRGISESAPEDQPGPAEEGLAEELHVLRRQLSPMVRDLRRFLQNVPDLPPPGEKLEIALGFLLASSRQHEAVAKWLADSDKHMEKAASKLRGLAEVAAPYLEVLRPWSLDGEQATFTMEEDPPAPVPAAPVTIDAEILDNLRRAVWCRRLFAEEQLETSFWELMMLNTAERVPTQARQAHIIQSKKDNQLAAFHEETRNLHARIMPIRARHGRWVEAFQSWLRDVSGVPKDAGEFELAVAFAVVEADGPSRARKWLETPEASAREAAKHLARLAMTAKAYVAALRKPASPGPQS